MAFLLSIRQKRQSDPAAFLLPFRPATDIVEADGLSVPRYTAEFWTSRQRAASSLHEVSYRACFKPALVRFFIDNLSHPGDRVYDPFAGRGTTALEAGLSGRMVASNDINPLSKILCRPRFILPDPNALERRLASIPMRKGRRASIDLSMFYHKDTESEIVSLRAYLTGRKEQKREDPLDRWIRMVATNRLSGHSPGFFSVYTLPPNQSVTPERQLLINRRLHQRPEYRDTRNIILNKSRSLLSDVTREQYIALAVAGQSGKFLTTDARRTKSIAAESVTLTVTSPPFLNIVDYATDNWLRCWFNDIDARKIAGSITTTPSLDDWSAVMRGVYKELYRVTRPGGWVAFEVGEVRNKRLRLDEIIVPLGVSQGFVSRAIVINSQTFTKTSNIWGINNNQRGTNTNRIVLFEKAV